MTNGQTVPTASSTIVVIGDIPTTFDIESGLHASADIDSIISVNSVDTALDLLERVPVQCLVYGFPSNDDDPDSFESIERVVDGAGDRPTIAVTAENATRALQAGAYDVIDPNMPLEAAVVRIQNAVERYYLESIPFSESVPYPELASWLESITAANSETSDSRPHPSFESTSHEALFVHDNFRLQCNNLESLLQCLYATGWCMRHAESRTQVEKRLCDGLSSLEDVDLSWVGRLTPEVVEVTPETWAVSSKSGDGNYDTYITEQTHFLESEELTPTAMTARSGTRTVIEDITTELSEFQWARTALEHGIRTICSVPIDFQGVTYGCLTICSTDPVAFDEWTVDATSSLGAVSAVLINRLDLRASLSADRMIELEIFAEAGNDPLTALAEYLDQRVDIEVFAPRSTSGSVGTLSVTSLPNGEQPNIASAIDGVQSVQVVTTDPSPTRIQVQFAEGTIAERLSDYGAVIRTLEPAGNRLRMTITIPADRSVRRIVQLLEEETANTELVTRRSELSTRDRSDRFEDRLERGLTERQFLTLQTAYYSGYFDWPREQTGEEIADALGVSQPTFTRHFRTAQRKLFELLFDQQCRVEGQ